jgi:hypothetical protein
MQKNLIISFLVVAVIVFGLFSLKHKSNTESQKISNDKKWQYNERETPIPCSFTLAKDDMYQIVLKDCENFLEWDGTVSPTAYTAKVVEVQKLDGTLVKSFLYNKIFDTNSADTINATVTHDSSGSYVFLGSGTWVVWELEIFSLTNGRTTSVSYMDGVITKNGYFVYTSNEGLQNVHLEVDQSNATNVVALKLSDFSKKVIFTGTADTDYRVNPEGNNKFLPTTDKDFITIDKITWKPDSNKQDIEQIKFPIDNYLTTDHSPTNAKETILENEAKIYPVNDMAVAIKKILDIEYGGSIYNIYECTGNDISYLKFPGSSFDKSDNLYNLSGDLVAKCGGGWGVLPNPYPKECTMVQSMQCKIVLSRDASINIYNVIK